MLVKDEFVQLVQAHQGILYKVANIYGNTAEDRQDLYQDIVYQLWKSFDSFRNESKISTWIYRVALNTSITRSKLERRKKVQISVEVLPDIADITETREHERSQYLFSLIAGLPIIDKGIIFLFLEGKSHEDIAAVTGFSVSNVGTRISRIKQKLKNQIIKKT